MRRPQMDPQEADATVRRRTEQGMARGRVPSAYPVPREQVPRVLGGVRATPEPVVPTIYVNGVHQAIPGTRPAPPATVYMIPSVWVPPVRGGAWINMISGINTGGWVLPDGWTSMAAGTIGDTDYEVCWCSHLTSPAGELGFPDWTVGESFLAIYSKGCYVGEDTDFPYDLNVTAVTTASDVTSQVMTDPPSGWSYGFSATFYSRHAAAGYPYVAIDRDHSGAGNSDYTGTPRYFGVLHPMDPDVENSAVPGNGATVSLLGTDGDFATLGLGWTLA